MLYPEEKIAIIERLILATDPNYTTPKDILEKIIKDADLDNL
jgi:predicted RNA binding protein YcfA (HicA-like mRNA interferase family)